MIASGVRSLVLGALALGMAAVSAGAQDWPTRPIRFIVGAGVGGGTDIITRIIAQPLSELLGQPIYIENRQGAGNIVAASTLVNAPKDGYTAYMMNNSHGVSAALFKSMPYDSVEDFAMVSLTGTAGLVLVTAPDFPAKDVKGLIAAAKAAPGKYNFASVGTGTTQHFSGELFCQLAGVDIKHIPYRGTPAAITALLQRDVQLTFELVQPVLGQIRSGDLRAVAVTSPQRYPALPDVPTVAESGLPEFQVMSWYGLAFPAGTPRPIVDKMNAGLREVLARDDVRKQMINLGATAQTSTPEELRRHIVNEIAKWSAVREKAGIAQQ
ncbi:MAG TPA: tripartite tricarboxylate transporter substrate binding protein [Xanthobacteraceae bacterium]|nr:tripartite tricarboxylate transporter substrate binding protein [Xanthobacteraceae bacterium]